MGAGGLAGGAERQSYKVVAPGWQERAVEKHLREAIIPHTANVHGAGSRRDPPCPCPAMLVIEGSTRRYGANASRRRCVPRDRRRRLHRRDRSINRLETPTAGCIRFGGIDVASLSGGEPARAARRYSSSSIWLAGSTCCQSWSDEDKAFTFSALPSSSSTSPASPRKSNSLVTYRGSIRLFGRAA